MGGAKSKAKEAHCFSVNVPDYRSYDIKPENVSNSMLVPEDIFKIIFGYMLSF